MSAIPALSAPLSGTLEYARRVSASDREEFERFRERWELFQIRLDATRRARGGKPAPRMRGVVATSKGLVPWQRSSSPGVAFGDPRVPRNGAVAMVDFDPPPIRRRTPAERLDDVTMRMEAEAVRAYRLTGKVALPQSLIHDMVAELRADDPTMTEDKLLGFTLERLRQAIRSYQTRVLIRASARYETNDGYQAPITGGK